MTEAVLEVINRLNFETDIFEAVINEKSEIIQETLVSSLSQAIIMEEMPLASDGNLFRFSHNICRRLIFLSHFKSQ